VDHPAVATVATTWLRWVEGSHGWTALPRLAAWLCVPALIAGAGAGVCRIGAIVSVTGPISRAITTSGSSIGVLFGMLGMLTSPVAAVLILALSIARLWRLRVLGVLWLLVTVAMGITLPAIDAALRDWMILQGAH
jgi:hypothetical protein